MKRAPWQCVDGVVQRGQDLRPLYCLQYQKTSIWRQERLINFHIVYAQITWLHGHDAGAKAKAQYEARALTLKILRLIVQIKIPTDPVVFPRFLSQRDEALTGSDMKVLRF